MPRGQFVFGVTLRTVGHPCRGRCVGSGHHPDGDGRRHRNHRTGRTPLPHSLGQFYAAMTAFLGFRPDHDEYIVMGLAASGEPTFAQVFRREIVRLLPLGRFELNTRLLDFHLARVGLFVKEFIHLFGAPRQPSDELTQRHRDLSGQRSTGSGGSLAASRPAPSNPDRAELSAWRGGWPTIVWRMVACVPNSGSNGCMCRRLRGTPVRHSGRLCGGRLGEVAQTTDRKCHPLIGDLNSRRTRVARHWSESGWQPNLYRMSSCMSGSRRNWRGGV